MCGNTTMDDCALVPQEHIIDKSSKLNWGFSSQDFSFLVWFFLVKIIVSLGTSTSWILIYSFTFSLFGFNLVIHFTLCLKPVDMSHFDCISLLLCIVGSRGAVIVIIYGFMNIVTLINVRFCLLGINIIK